jgi:hypothetical protein
MWESKWTGLTNWEWVMVGEEVGQWQMGGRSLVEERGLM